MLLKNLIIYNIIQAANIHKNKSGRKGEEALDPDEFIKFYEMLISRPELDTLFKKYNNLL